MSSVSQELALGMSLALESAESDLERIAALLEDRADPAESRALAMQLVARALRRVQSVKEALDDAVETRIS
jgi:HEAT repeat protein